VTSREPEKRIDKMLVGIGDSLSIVASSTMGRMGKTRMIKRLSRASRAMMTIPAG
jgi:hypothetical protein